MPTSAQDASITWGSVTLSQVIDYTVDCAFNARDPGEAGSVVVRAYANSIPPDQLGRYLTLTISHGGVIKFKAACVAERVRIEARTNDVLRYALTFRIYFPHRSY
jgi:hypothetical protein